MGDEDDDGLSINRKTPAVTPDVPRKSILKKTAPKAKVGFKDSLDSSIEREDERPTMRNKRSKSVASNRSSTQSNISRFSQVSLDPADPAFRILTALVVFKILFLDVASSIGDNITDFLQGFNLIFNFNRTPGKVPPEPWLMDWSTARYGVGVICINWLPGVVAVIHMLAFHRTEYLVPADDLPKKHEDETDGVFNNRIVFEKKDRLKRKKRFLYSILICLLAYPIVPTVMHILVIWRMNSLQDTITFSRTQLFASIARSISGCIESPIQVIITLWLIMKDIIPVPWGTSFDTGAVSDQYGNTISFPKIPVVSMAFSILNILASVIQINIMSVYIGHVKNMVGFKKFFTLSLGHLPFFLSTIIFRISAISFILVYLDWKALAFFIPMFLCNLLIGYTTYSTYKLPKKLKREIKRMKSIKRKEANPSEANHPSLRRQDTKKEKERVNSPVWLNSFLSLCVPCCYIHDIDHNLLESMDERYRIEAEKRQKAFQKKVMQYQVLGSSLLLLTAIGIICYTVNTHNLRFGNNRFNNIDFNISCGVLLIMALISLTFVKELDVFEFFRMNEEEKDDCVQTITIEKRPMSRARISKMEVQGEDEPDAGQIIINVEDGEEATVQVQERRERKTGWPMPAKILVSLVLTALTLAPPIIGYKLSISLPAVNSAYTVVKFEESGNYSIRITKAFIVNIPNQNDISGTISSKEKSEWCKQPNNANNILVADLDDIECLQKVSKLYANEETNNYKAVILIENWDNRSSSPYPDMVGKTPDSITPTYDIRKLKGQTKIPVISIRKPDKDYFSTSLSTAYEKDSNFALDISFKSLDSLLEVGPNADSQLYKTSCNIKDKSSNCLHFFSDPPKNGEYFLGCNGMPKKRVNMDIKCKSYSKDCPELKSFEKTLPSKAYAECAHREYSWSPKTNIYPPMTCRQEKKNEANYYDLSTINCVDENTDGKPFFEASPNVCTEGMNWQKNSQSCDDGAKCNNWGPWSAYSDCKSKHEQYRKERYRFCKIPPQSKNSAKRCVIMEKEIWLSNYESCGKQHKCKN